MNSLLGVRTAPDRNSGWRPYVASSQALAQQPGGPGDPSEFSSGSPDGTGSQQWFGSASYGLKCSSTTSGAAGPRPLAEEWTYRFLAAAHTWALTEPAALHHISSTTVEVADLDQAPAAPEPSTAEVRAWARSIGLPVPDRGRLHPQIWHAWREHHQRPAPDSQLDILRQSSAVSGPSQ